MAQPFRCDVLAVTSFQLDEPAEVVAVGIEGLQRFVGYEGAAQIQHLKAFEVDRLKIAQQHGFVYLGTLLKFEHLQSSEILRLGQGCESP